MSARSRFVVIAAVTLMIGGCSHGTVGELPTAPSATIRTLTITPTGGGSLIAGQTAEITTSGPMPSGGALGAYAQYTDGSGKYVEANWTTSDAAVMIVSNATMRAVGRGTATLTASFEGKTDSETFQVEPGIAGTWIGTYVVDTCAAGSAALQELICGVAGRTPGVLPVGAAAPIGFQITQSGTDLTAVAAFGEFRGTLTGSDRNANFLTLRGDLTSNTSTLTLIHWDTRVRTDLMEGFIAFEWRIAGVSSFAQVTAHLGEVTRR
jgi:hypothetical protein